MELFASLKSKAEPKYRPRPYQAKAVDSVFVHWDGGARSVLVQLATGLGKSSVGAFIASRFLDHNVNRVLVLVNRDELVRQWCDAFADVCPNEYVDIEQGKQKASTDKNSLTNRWGKRRSPVRIVVASKDTLWRDKRLQRFEQDEFGLIIIDECSGWVEDNSTWHNIVMYFNQAKVVGLDATPLRGDKKPLLFDSIACEYPIWDAVNDGWLVEPIQQYVMTEGFDMSGLRDQVGKDWTAGEIDRAWRKERPMQALAGQIVDWAVKEGKKRRPNYVLSTLVFNSSVEMARDLADILNRRHARDGTGKAAVISSLDTDLQERRQILADFEAGEIKYLSNWGIATKGFDCPNIEMVVLSRKTKNHALMQQMIGRGLRPLSDTAFRLNAAANAQERKAIIAACPKPNVIILDPIGETGMHSLEVDMVDIIGFGEYDAEIIRFAKNRAMQTDGRMTMEELEETKAKVQAERREYQAKESFGRRDFIVDGETVSRTIGGKPNDLGIKQERKQTPSTPTSKQIEILRKGKINELEIQRLSFGEAGKLVNEIKRRWRLGLCSVNQYRAMLRYGVPKDKADQMTKKEASEVMDVLSKNGWKLPELYLS